MSSAVGDITRGTTNPNRLRRVDRWVLHAVCSTIRKSEDPLIVDLGYGALPVTTRELFERIQKHVRPDCEVVGIEIDPERVEQAKSIEQSDLSFKYGGFEIPTGPRNPILIRAFNVLRQYDESEVREAWATMTARLAPHGYLVEGTCDEIGRRSVWVTLRDGESEPETITFSAHLDSLEQPSDLAPRLPKVLIHKNVPGENIHEFLKDFDQAWLTKSSLIPFGARQRFIATVELLAQKHPIMDNKERWRLGEVTVPWQVFSESAKTPRVLGEDPSCAI